MARQQRGKTLFVLDSMDGRVEAFLLRNGKQVEILVEDEYGNCTSADLSIDLATELAEAILSVRQGVTFDRNAEV
jgi:hypothetical protein